MSEQRVSNVRKQHVKLTLTEWLWKSVMIISLLLLTAAKCGPTWKERARKQNHRMITLHDWIKYNIFICLLQPFLTAVDMHLPANCLSPIPRLPNLVTSFPLGWKMKTVQALLSTTITWPFWSTDTPFGPISLPEPSLAFRKIRSLKLEFHFKFYICLSVLTKYNWPCICPHWRRC